jgi:uncharacterized protein YebE (UPF0316 family)
MIPMNIEIYIFIFVAKIIENAINTLRVIVVAHGKKLLGAILMFVSALIWIAVTGIVVNDLMKDLWKIFFFAFGSFVGSYIGSIVEEKIALGDNLLTFVIEECDQVKLEAFLQQNKYTFFFIRNDKQLFLLVVAKRKKRHEIISLIRTFVLML